MATDSTKLESKGFMSDLSLFAFEVVQVDAQGAIAIREKMTAHCRIEDLGQGVTLEMVAIPAGLFLMGSPQTEKGWHPTQSPQHFVEVNPFFLAKYPITQAQWQVVAQLDRVKLELIPNPSKFPNDDRPVEQISWHEAVEFCNRLSQKTGRNYHLPGEAQWEYACRASTQTPFHFGETINTDLANYSGVNWEYMGKICSRGSYGRGPLGTDYRETTPVGSFQVANAFGLYDMHGNVREWCADDWHDNYERATMDGTPRMTGTDRRVLRGGSWNVGPRKCRSAYRGQFPADASLYDIGFRVAMS